MPNAYLPHILARSRRLRGFVKNVGMRLVRNTPCRRIFNDVGVRGKHLLRESAIFIQEQAESSSL